jgi:uncharacterized membrane protein YgcG
MMMLVLEPILWCFGQDNGGKLFYEYCKEADSIQFAYSFFSMLAMLLYFLLLIDLAVLSTKVSAYVLVCIRMVAEVGLFMLALTVSLLAFSSAISVLKHEQEDFAGLPKGMMKLLEMVMRMFDGKHFELYESDPMALICVFVFLIVVTIFLFNMLVAQLTCSYEAVYVDMVGYARLERIEIIVNTMPVVTQKRWKSFCTSLRLDEKLEFNAGDIGVTGGIQIYEAANANPTTVDMIKRFGGSTSVEMQWPAETEVGDENDRFERMEALIQKTLKRIAKGGGGGSRGGTQSGSGSAGMSGSNSGDDNADEDEDRGHSDGDASA